MANTVTEDTVIKPRYLTENISLTDCVINVDEYSNIKHLLERLKTFNDEWVKILLENRDAFMPFLMKISLFWDKITFDDELIYIYDVMEKLNISKLYKFFVEILADELLEKDINNKKYTRTKKLVWEVKQHVNSWIDHYQIDRFVA